jgi:glycogen debranching enzyme
MFETTVQPPPFTDQVPEPNDVENQVVIAGPGHFFAVLGPNGVIRPEGAYGAFGRDHRLCSWFELVPAEGALQRVKDRALSGFAAHFHSRNYSGDLDVWQHFLMARRVMTYRLTIRNRSGASRVARLWLDLASDCADMMHLRGCDVGGPRGQLKHPLAKTTLAGENVLRSSYYGLDGKWRGVLIRFPGLKPREIDSGSQSCRAAFELSLAPGEKVTIRVLVSPLGPCASEAEFGTVGLGNSGSGLTKARQNYQKWRAGCALVRTSHEPSNTLLAASDRALHMLRTDLPAEPTRQFSLCRYYPGPLVKGWFAGYPGFAAIFGRDWLIAAILRLIPEPEMARSAIIYMNRRLATEEDEQFPKRDARVGKVLHEERVGELAGAGRIEHGPSFLTADATALATWLEYLYYKRTGDLAFVRAEWTYTLRKLEFLLAEATPGAGLGYTRIGYSNKCWKDSERGIPCSDPNRVLQGPMYTIEIQAYMACALKGGEELATLMGDSHLADQLRDRRRELINWVRRAFWMPEKGFPAMAWAPDGLADVFGSNQLHALLAEGLFTSQQEQAILERALRPDMWSLPGLVTLSREERAFDPYSYHLGSSWAHDGAIAAIAAARAGEMELAHRQGICMADVSMQMPSRWLDELYCGLPDQLVRYKAARSPQLWAAAAPSGVLATYFGIEINGPEGWLAVSPSLPPWMDEATMTGLQVGSCGGRIGYVDLRARRSCAHGRTSVEILQAPHWLNIDVGASARAA